MLGRPPAAPARSGQARRAAFLVPINSRPPTSSRPALFPSPFLLCCLPVPRSSPAPLLLPIPPLARPGRAAYLGRIASFGESPSSLAGAPPASSQSWPLGFGLACCAIDSAPWAYAVAGWLGVIVPHDEDLESALNEVSRPLTLSKVTLPSLPSYAINVVASTVQLLTWPPPGPLDRQTTSGKLCRAPTSAQSRQCCSHLSAPRPSPARPGPMANSGIFPRSLPANRRLLDAVSPKLTGSCRPDRIERSSRATRIRARQFRSCRPSW